MTSSNKAILRPTISDRREAVLRYVVQMLMIRFPPGHLWICELLLQKLYFVMCPSNPILGEVDEGTGIC